MGTPPNLFLASFAASHLDVEGSDDLARGACSRLGPMSRGEAATLVVFALTACTWVGRPLLSRIEVAGARPLAGLTDPGIAVLAALALFVLPVDVKRRIFVMDWDTATLVPIFAALAPGLGVEPMLVVVPAAIGASCAFMLPVATLVLGIAL